MTVSKSGKGAFGMPAANEQESYDLLNAFARKGGNLIDTADRYPESEEVIGRWLSTQKRDDFVIATKVGFGSGGINDSGLNRRHILEAIDSSLKKLQTDHIDLYQAHLFDPKSPMEDTFKTFDDLVRSGKARYIGVSNFTGAQLQKAIDLTKMYHWEKIICLQPQYNLLCRFIEWELIPICIQENIAVIPWSPLASGYLTGKHKEKPEEQTRVSLMEQIRHPLSPYAKFNNDNTKILFDSIESIAKENNMTFAQVALRWVLQKPGITSPIIGARTMAHLTDALGILEKSLTDEQMKKLDDLSAVPPPYPWRFV